MPLRSLLSLLLIALGNSAVAYEYPIAIWNLADGGTCRIVFDNKVEERLTERWSGEGEPPVSIGRAKEIATSWATEEYGPNIQSTITEFKLFSFRGEETKTNHWVYVIQFVKFKNGQPHPNFMEQLAVLMDETVLTKSCSTNSI